MREEKKGPRVGAPENAIAGFLKAAGLKSIGEAKVQPDKKGDFYVAVIEKPGRAAIEVIGEILPEVIKSFPVAEIDALGRAVEGARRAHLGAAAAFDRRHVRAGDRGAGHRAVFGRRHRRRQRDARPSLPGAGSRSRCAGFADYLQKLDKAKVVLDAERRRDIILTEAKQLAFAQGLELVEDEGLLDEVAGLVEWPVVLMGSFDESFLHIPEEVIRATIRNNQKCFVLRDAAHAKLVNKFILVSNIEAEDGGKAIVAGNERVIRARLSDAKFFYETDLKTRLEDRLPKFKHIVFHEKLGTQAERIERIERLAGELAPLVGADVEKAKRAARLCKADLLTEVVGEFPELQGLMGKYYAEAQGEDEAVAHAMRGSLQAEGAGRSGAGRSGVDRGRAGGQDRHAGWFLGDRRKADGEQRSLCAAEGGARSDSACPGKRSIAADRIPLLQMRSSDSVIRRAFALGISMTACDQQASKMDHRAGIRYAVQHSTISIFLSSPTA